MTLISGGTSGGARFRCDARCHDATGAKCACICGGRYHGKKSGSTELHAAIKETEAAVCKEGRAKGWNIDGLASLVGGELFTL